MSHYENSNTLDKQLANLHVLSDMRSTTRIKKVPPAVPPKKKSAPQVPQSCAVNNLREPLYSRNISPITYDSFSSNKYYENIPEPAINLDNDRTSYNIENKTHPNDSALPPPPPPLPPSPTLFAAYSLSDNNHNDNLISPPSPVSSNYSELFRATSNINYNNEGQNYPPIYQNDYQDFGASQGPTYESIYEPISPRSQSSFSVDSNKSNQTTSGKLHKEQEVDTLTDLLVKSISDSHDIVFGVCVKCDEKVIGENAGCTAMGNMYHVQCFTCHHCNKQLKGKPFYAVEGNPYCEEDYYETLEKCSVCNVPILDRILRATGKPYHPKCFMCVVCGKSLDGIPFTVDALNQIHCIEDFHKKFAPRCCVCKFPIMPEEGQEETVRVVALDRSYHVKCYCCEDCGLSLSSEAKGRGCYPLDDHILCKECNGHRVRLITNVITTDL